LKLTLKQQRFADEYIISGNATQAAIKAGYSKRTAGVIADENLKKPKIRAYIDERLAELNAKAIADQDEVLRLLTRHARRETTEYNVTKSGGVVKTPTAVANAIKAAELLGKRYGLFTDRVEADVDMDLNINIDYGPDS
jgi:phage terminase small subunit